MADFIDDFYPKIDDPYYQPTIVEGKNFGVVLIPKASQDYIDYGNLIQSEKDIYKKIEYCHLQLGVLKFMIDSELDSPMGMKCLPPYIACRDTAPRLYMRLGKWNEAEQFIKSCAEIRGYYPANGEEELSYLCNYKKIAELTFNFIRQNPGICPKDLYKHLSLNSEDLKICKDLIRWSMLIQKEPYKNTNRLFIIE